MSVITGVVGVVGGCFHAQTKECKGAERVRVEDGAATVTLGALTVTLGALTVTAHRRTAGQGDASGGRRCVPATA